MQLRYRFDSLNFIKFCPMLLAHSIGLCWTWETGCLLLYIIMDWTILLQVVAILRATECQINELFCCLREVPWGRNSLSGWQAQYLSTTNLILVCIENLLVKVSSIGDTFWVFYFIGFGKVVSNLCMIQKRRCIARICNPNVSYALNMNAYKYTSQGSR